MLKENVSLRLKEIEEFIFEHETTNGSKIDYDIETFRAATKIFMSILMTKAWELQEEEEMDFEDRINMVTKTGQDLRKLVKTYTGIDTYDLYK